jgi:hypothetical protein
MVVESQVDLNIPDPNFKAVSKDDENAVEDLKNEVAYVVRAADPNIEQLNLETERQAMKYGAFFKVHWNNDAQKAGYMGEIEISNPHAKDIIPNKAATGLDDMEHYHHVANRTVLYILRKWDDLTLDDLDRAQLYEEYDQLGDTERITAGNTDTSGDKEAGLNKYSIIETTYRDEEGDICKLWWSGDLLIDHKPKFFYRRDEAGNIMQSEPLEPGMQIRTGYDQQNEAFNYRPVNHTYTEDTGEPITEEVEYFIPKCWDIIYWPYMPRDKSFWGVSIMEDIWDIQEAIKKAIYMHEERMLRGTKKLIVPDETIKTKLLDPLSEVIVYSDPQGIKEVDFGDDLDIVAWIEKLKEWMQLITGATNAALGLEMPGVTSGKQAQAYIEQANFKVALKSAYKASAYKQLYKVIASFAMAFCDNDRPYRLKGDRDTAVYGTFNRLNMIRDMSGNLIWPDYDIEIGAETGFMKSKPQIMQAITDLARSKAFDPTPGNLTYLKILHKLGVPSLEEAIDEMQQELDFQRQLAMQNAQAQTQAQQMAQAQGMVQQPVLPGGGGDNVI